MKNMTDHEFLIKLIDEYRYFAKNKKYKYDLEYDIDSSFINSNSNSNSNSKSINNPPKQTYDLEVSLKNTWKFQK